jgi:hypothetical protein
MKKQYGILLSMLLFGVILVAGCSLPGSGTKDGQQVPLNDKSEYSDLLGKFHQNVQNKIQSSFEMFITPNKYNGEGSVNLSINSEKIPGNEINFSMEYTGKSDITGWMDDINNVKGFYEGIVRFSGSVSQPSIGTLTSAALSFSLQQMGDKYFFSLKDVSYDLVSETGEAFPQIDFSSVENTIYYATYDDLMKRMGGVSPTDFISSADSLEMFRLIQVTFSQTPLPFQFQEKVSEEGERITYAVSLDKELLKKHLDPLVSYVQKVSDSQSDQNTINMKEKINESIDQISYEGTLILDKNDSSFFQTDGTLSNENSPRQLLVYFSADGNNMSMELRDKEIDQEVLNMEYKDGNLSIVSGGILFALQNTQGRVDGSLAFFSSKLSEFSFSKEDGGEGLWSGTISFLTGEDSIVVNVKDVIFDAKKIIKGNFSTQIESFGDIVFSYAFGINPSEDISIVEPENVQPIDVFLQNISTIVFGIIGTAGSSVIELEVSPTPLLEASPEVSLDGVPVE